MTWTRLLLPIVGALCAIPAAAQITASTSSAPRRPSPVAEGTLGWSGFADEGIVHHGLFGTGARVYLTPRVSVGPELQYMVGPDQDRDLLLTGNLVFDVRGPAPNATRRWTPYVVAGGGLFRHSDRFLTGTYTSTEGAFTAGAGVRAWTTDRVSVAADARLGWELHVRLAATVGVALK
jgi:hypothetical protein